MEDRVGKLKFFLLKANTYMPAINNEQWIWYFYAFILIWISWNLLYSYSKYEVLIIFIQHITFHIDFDSPYLNIYKQNIHQINMNRIRTLMVISFLQRRCHPVTRCIKKIAEQSCYNVFFYLRKTEHKY